MIRTVLGDIAPEALGFTLPHEHLIGHPPAEFAEDDLQLTREDEAIRELQDFASVGGSAIVEMTTPDYARDVFALQRLSKASGVHLVAATGFNKAKFADRYTSPLSEEVLVAWLVSEVSEGITEPPAFVTEGGRETTARAGLLKASTSLNGPTTAEGKVLRAVAKAHRQTGAPVGTHTERATWALEQAWFLIDHGVDPSKLLIGHLDFNLDFASLSKIAGLGVYLGLDQFSKIKYLPDEQRVDLVVALTDSGFGNQLLLSGDMARRSYWRTSGGPGFRHLPTLIRQKLGEAGMMDDTLERFFVHNPRAWLSF